MLGMLDRAPLRIKLVAAILGLVAVALLVIGAASVFLVRGYLVDRMDTQMGTVAYAVTSGQIRYGTTFVMPCDYWRRTSVSGVTDELFTDRLMSDADMPKVVTGVDAVQAAD